MGDSDILQVIPDSDLSKLRDLYKKLLPRASYIHNYLNSVIRWKTQRPEKNYITVMAPNGNWKDGTFFAVHQYFCYELVMFTFEDDCKTLYRALVDTKKIKWNQRLWIYAVYNDHYPVLLKALDKTAYRIHHEDPCGIWWIPSEKALQFEVLYEGSDRHIATMIEMNGGCGVFLKSNNKLVAWILRNLLGLCALQTAEVYRGKGYASLVTKALSKELAEEGIDPLTTILEGNSVSQAMFKKLGFELLEKVVFVENQEGN